MISLSPTSQKQRWLARGAIVAALVMFIILKFAPLEISAVKDGNTTLYKPPLVLPVISSAMGILTGVAALVFWMQPASIFRLFAIILAMIASYVLFNAPTGLNHHLIVTADSFKQRIGPWYSPWDTKVEFNSLAYLSVERTKDGAYAFQAYTKSGEEIFVPVHDLMRKAVPEIMQRAGQCGVVIGDGPDGLPIPAALGE